MTAVTLEEHERRLTALEERMDRGAQHGAGGDLDPGGVATLKAQHSLLQALAISESQHTETLARLDRQNRELRGEFDVLRSEVREGMRQLVGMLDILIKRDER